MVDSAQFKRLGFCRSISAHQPTNPCKAITPATAKPMSHFGDRQTGNWFILRSEDFSFFAFPFGANGDTPVPGDYDGDGKFDAGVFRPTNQTWFIQRSTAGTLITISELRAMFRFKRLLFRNSDCFRQTREVLFVREKFSHKTVKSLRKLSR